VSQFIPTIGTYLAGALPVLIALFHDPVDALWVLVFITIYQQFENMILSPRITARTMSLHPAVAFGAVIAGGAIAGPIGALLALPAAASIQALISLYAHRYEVVTGPLTGEQPVAAPAGSR
jgi:predicted PurR-regulated permease PerM